MDTRKWQIYAPHLLVQVGKLDILPGLPNKQTKKRTNTVSKRWRISWSSDKSGTSVKFEVVNCEIWKLRDDCQVYYILATFESKLKQNSSEIIRYSPVNL